MAFPPTESDTLRLGSVDAAQRSSSELSSDFAISQSLPRSSDPERSGSRPRVLFVHGRDPAKMMPGTLGSSSLPHL